MHFCLKDHIPEGPSWRNTTASPLPVNNRTVLHLLRSLQYLQTHGEAQRVSFRALGIEQIGHVYEGLLDHTAKRAIEPVLGLSGGKGREPEIALSKLEELWGEWSAESGEEPPAKLIEFLKSETGRSASALTNALHPNPTTLHTPHSTHSPHSTLLQACGNDKKLFERVEPFAGLLANDSFDRPVVIRKGSVYVTAGTDRRTSGTHYTPTSLTEPIVKHTLDPLCYVGPAEGKPEGEWQLRSPKELLDLKICDMACGSGAFLVQACRYMSELLVEAWEQAANKAGGGKPVKDLRITPYGEPSTGAADEQLIPLDTEERLVYARRLVAQRCVYGVDKNPLAVEMAKLSLWLLTLAKDKPFTFLDHCIRAGDSLVGISSIEQLLRFSLDERVSTGPLLEQQRKQIEKRLDAVKLLRRQIEEQPSNTPQDIERKAAMLKNADEQTRRLTYAADMLLAESWQPMTAAEREAALNSTLVQVEYKFKDLPVTDLDAASQERLQRAGIDGRFHWPLEFPEVFEDAGFNAFLCNPPFIGGTLISGRLSKSYQRFLTSTYCEAIPSGGRGDLCAYFFRRGGHLLRANGALGFLATNTIGQGDTREIGLAHMLANGFSAYRAVSSEKWPGAANLEVAHLWITKGEWNGIATLDGQSVVRIPPSLSFDLAGDFVPQRLAANRGRACEGSKTLGMGFVIEDEEARSLMSKDARNREVLFPFINGEDINSSFDQSTSRWVICFFDWPIEKAKRYTDCWDIIEERVRPERQRKNGKGEYVLRKPLPQKYWLFGDSRTRFYESIRDFQRILVAVQTSKYVNVSFQPTDRIFSQALVMIASDDDGNFAVLNSTLHESWIAFRCSSLETRLRYLVSDGFDTFPFPDCVASCQAQGRGYETYRASLMAKRQEGLTDIYNRFHDCDEAAKDIQKLRDLHVEMDQAVAAAYGWDDLDLGHDFHTTKQGERFTISEPARCEVLQRLLKLNHERYAEEVKQGLHDKKRKAKKTDAPKRRKKSAASGPGLFGDDDDEGG